MTMRWLSAFAWRRACIGPILLLALAGCATWHEPASVDDTPLRERAVSATNRGVQVRAAVLGKDDTKRMLGADLANTHVQPLWVEVSNGTSQTVWLLRTGTDPRYFSPREVAWSLHSTFGGDSNARIDAWFDKLSFRNPIPPGTTQAGLLFTNPDRGTKLCNIDLFANRTLIPFSLFLPVPDDVGDPRFAETQYRYPEYAVTDYHDAGAFRAALERMPCCATDSTGTVHGDPLNAVFVGKIDDLATALVRRDYHGYTRADDLSQRFDGRVPDVVLRKESTRAAPATWLRMWIAPLRFNGEPVYLVQIGRPIGGRFTSPERTIFILQQNVDEARNHFVQDMVYSGGLEKIGFVNGVEPAPRTRPNTTLDGASYHTDGLRAVLFFTTRPLSLTDVEFLDWVPYLQPHESLDEGADDNANP
ncbi:LssY C-terminal domain-containing protein [Paraburkholderia sp. J94]|uniref:LssY C-terminal domain-containing protein n=1 Tax=Paraburkholderia sp. J94 TaxID=2805441 RepID=UPI002AAF1216|nr:LssY C-terminal domain-containing protein [Paraburkholderia sp. J94]